jgi:hypothetical protein
LVSPTKNPATCAGFFSFSRRKADEAFIRPALPDHSLELACAASTISSATFCGLDVITTWEAP